MPDLHWFKFHPSDWRSDPALRMCSLAARGLWIEMLGLMHEAKPRGFLLVKGRAPTDTQLAVLAGTSSDQITDLLGELELADVFSRTQQGVIYSRRMTKDDKKSRTARKNGKTGGNPSLSKIDENSPLDNLEDNQTHKLRDQKLEAREEPRAARSHSRSKFQDPAILLQAEVDPVTARNFADHMRQRGPRLTEQSTQSLVAKLRRIRDEGGNAGEALRLAMDSGWGSNFEIEWLRNKGMNFKAPPNSSTMKDWPDEKWQRILNYSRNRGEWLNTYGPPPFADGCLVPAHLIVDGDRNLTRVAA